MTFSRSIKKYIELLYFHSEKIRWKTPENWKLKNPIQEPDYKVTVNFIVPLISNDRARSWDIVCRNLQRTLRSLERQTSDKWTVTICGQDRPDGIDFNEQIKLAISRFVWVGCFPVMRGTHQMLWYRVRLAGG